MIGATAPAEPGASACLLSSSERAAATASREKSLAAADDDARRERRSSSECDVEPRCLVLLELREREEFESC